MKIFESERAFKKLIIILICILLLSFCMPKTVKATDDGGVGGKLLNPVMSLFVGMGDGAMTLLQDIVFHMDASLITIDSSSSWWAKVLVVVAAVVVVSVIIAATVLTAGAARTYYSWNSSSIKRGGNFNYSYWWSYNNISIYDYNS